jgi:glyoxylase-like metal-dependent hydrolase (beta-lactamase superfamily II)
MAIEYSVHVSHGRERAGDDRMPDGSPLMWSPLATVLIEGDRDAFLVDPPFLVDQIDEVIDWVARSGKRLVGIYATHGHGDHWFGTARIQERFPGARAWATPGTIELMRLQATTAREVLWDRIFPGLLPATPVVAQPVPEDGLWLEGAELVPVEVGHSDTDATTVLWVPSIGLVVAGDVVYNGVHQFLAEGAHGGFERWQEALDQVDELHATSVVAGHKDARRADWPEAIGETRRYLSDVIEVSASGVDRIGFFDEMLRRWPERLNPSPVWYGAPAVLAVAEES